MSAGSIRLGLLAGVLSPCVLSLLPVVLFGAAAAHRTGPAILALRLATSFTATGLFVATIGFASGLDGGVFRALSAIMLPVLGCVLLSTSRQPALVVSRLGDGGARMSERLRPRGATGPAPGAASLIALRGADLAAVGATMLAFGADAAVPLLLVAAFSRQALLRWRGRATNAGSMADRRSA